MTNLSKNCRVGADNGWLRLTLSKAVSERYFEVSQKRIYLKGLPDTTENRVIAQRTANHISNDIDYGSFDVTLTRYGLGLPSQAITPANQTELTLTELFTQFTESKNIKANTLKKYQDIQKYTLAKCPITDYTDAIGIKKWLVSEKSSDTAKLILIYLKACVDWGIKRHLITLETNPFLGISDELPAFNYQKESKPNPFTDVEIYTLLQAIKPYYVSFVRFLLLTGCRPSEAIGLCWKNVGTSYIHFVESLNHVSGKAVINEGSKNNKKRKFPINNELEELIETINTVRHPNNLVFVSPSGKPINYANFSRRQWKSVSDTLARTTTPYCCRDTFITQQIAKGVPIAVVAQWCDTSSQMIERHYLGDTTANGIFPR
jgi:integrase